MDEDRIVGAPRNVGGKMQEGFNRVTGEAAAQVKGTANQAAGAAQELYGQTADAARDVAQGVREVAS